MVQLSQAISGAASIEDLNKVFENIVDVRLGMVNDQVSVGGYDGAVTTDVIAQRVFALHGKEDSASKKLASYLAEKVFSPLHTLVMSPENRYSSYQFFAFARIRWTPPQDPRFGESVALKHAMVLGCLV